MSSMDGRPCPLQTYVKMEVDNLSTSNGTVITQFKNIHIEDKDDENGVTWFKYFEVDKFSVKSEVEEIENAMEPLNEPYNVLPTNMEINIDNESPVKVAEISDCDGEIIWLVNKTQNLNLMLPSVKQDIVEMNENGATNQYITSNESLVTMNPNQVEGHMETNLDLNDGPLPLPNIFERAIPCPIVAKPGGYLQNQLKKLSSNNSHTKNAKKSHSSEKEKKKKEQTNTLFKKPRKELPNGKKRLSKEPFCDGIEIDCDRLSIFASEWQTEKVIKPHPGISRFILREKPNLQIKYKSDVFVEDRGPLGCCFDEALGLHILVCTQSGKIRFVNENGKCRRDAISGLITPSAVTIIKPGHSFAILTYKRIYVYEYATKKIHCVAKIENNENGYFRTLCAIDGETIFTMKTQRIMGEAKWAVVLYKAGPLDFNQVVKELVYPVLDPSELERARPSFASCSHDRFVYITDLGLQRLVNISFNSPDVNFSIVHLQGGAILNGHSARFARVSGVESDRYGFLLVCDCLKRKLYVMNNAGKIFHDVEVVMGNGRAFPYASQISLGRHTLVTANRSMGGFSLFSIEAAGVCKSEIIDLEDY